MVEKENILLIFFGIVFLLSTFLIIRPYFLFGEKSITGFATSGTTISNVSVTKAFSITMSANLTAGIQFGNLSTITNANATGNYYTADDSNESLYFVNMSADATINTDICIKANAPLTDSSTLDTIGIGNETYANATSTSTTIPALANEFPINTTYVKSGANFGPGAADYYRFWLDIPSSVGTGTYNNSITFLAIETGDACA